MYDKSCMKLKALIVESTGYYLELLGNILSDIGVDYDTYTNGKEALESDNKSEYSYYSIPSS